MASTDEEGRDLRKQYIVPDEIHEAVRVAAFERRISMSELVREALEKHPDIRPHVVRQEEAI